MLRDDRRRYLKLAVGHQGLHSLLHAGGLLAPPVSADRGTSTNTKKLCMIQVQAQMQARTSG